MNARINEHQLNLIISYILNEFETFGVQKNDEKIMFESLKKSSDFVIWADKPIISFKKILWPNGQEMGKRNNRKIAFLGLANCDAEALSKFFLEFNKTDLLIERKNILVVTTKCKPDENCFCQAFGKVKFQYSDIHIQKNGRDFEIFGLTPTGKRILENTGVKKTLGLEIEELLPQNIEQIDKNELSNEIDNKEKWSEYWQEISDNCFGCGACTAVCPLCFCFRQNSKNTTDGKCKNCLEWDSCFSTSFSQIQHHFDFRPTNKDRLYNWYHHKFDRAYFQNKHFLCTGCGRCIKACPAHLNQYRIISHLVKKND